MRWRLFVVKEQMWALYWTAEMSVFITLMFITQSPQTAILTLLSPCLSSFHISCGLHFLFLWFSWSRSYLESKFNHFQLLCCCFSLTHLCPPWKGALNNNNNLASKLQYSAQSTIFGNYYLELDQSCLMVSENGQKLNMSSTVHVHSSACHSVAPPTGFSPLLLSHDLALPPWLAISG